MKVFEYDDILEGNKETYFKIKESEIDKLSHFIHHNFKRCGGFRVLHKRPKEEKQLSKFKSMVSETSTSFGYYEFQKALLPDYSINQESTVQKWFPEISIEYMNSIVTHLSSYKTRYYKCPRRRRSLEMDWF